MFLFLDSETFVILSRRRKINRLIMLACAVAIFNIVVSDQIRYKPRRYQSNAITRRESACALARPQLGVFLPGTAQNTCMLSRKRKTDPLISMYSCNICFHDFRPGPIQTRLDSQSRWLHCRVRCLETRDFIRI